MNTIREKLIAAGVKNLHEFGYPQCNADNILTDEIFASFFKSMLDDNKGHGQAIDLQIDLLLHEMRVEESTKARARKDHKRGSKSARASK